MFQKALVTGASSGIGRAFVEALHGRRESYAVAPTRKSRTRPSAQ